MFRMTYNQANIKGGILVTCSCNFVFGKQVVSTKEFQRNLVIRSLNCRGSKRKGKGISEAQKVDWEPVHSRLGCGKRTLLDYEQSLFFLSRSSEMRGTRKWPH